MALLGDKLIPSELQTWVTGQGYSIDKILGASVQESLFL